MNLSNTLAVYQKELLEMIRDKRTLISMVLIPLVAIPLMFRLMSFFMQSREKEARGQAVSLGIRSELNVADVLAALRAGGFETTVKADLREAVEKKEVAAAIEEVREPGKVTQLKIYIDRTRQASDVANDKLRTVLDNARTGIIRASLRGSGLPDSILTPFQIERVNVASEKKMSGFILGSMVGYMIILLMFTGAMYPAIDMTAGEKERRTMEALLCSPASRLDLVLGKVLGAATAAFITACLVLGSMAYSIRSFPQPSGSPFAFKAAPDPQIFALVLLAAFPTAVFAASLMIAIALFAKSYKEGQSYLTPILMLVAFPAVAGMLPGLELTPALAMIPIFNVCQIIKEIFLGDYSRTAFAISVAANFIYAAIAFFVAARLFKTEGVLFRV